MRGPARLTMGGKPLMVRMLDISLGGMLVVSNVNMAIKQSVKLEFNILMRKSGAYTSITTIAAVAYSAFSNEENGFKLGLQFAGLSDAYKMLIIQYVGIKKPSAVAGEPAKETEELAEDDAVESVDTVRKASF